MNFNIISVYNKPYVFAGNNQRKANTPKAVSFGGQELITPEVKEKLPQIAAEIQKANKIAIVTHTNPDEDAIGSSAALKNLIASKYPDKKIDVFIVGKMPHGAKCVNDVNSFETLDKNFDFKSIKARNYDLAISVDCAKKDLMKDGSKVFESAKKTIKIDHHSIEDDLKAIKKAANLTDKKKAKAIKRIDYADINLVCGDASSASQVVLLLADHMGVPLNKELATDVYMAIVGDTCGFRYMTKPAGVFEDCSRLTKTGIDQKESRKIYCTTMDYMPKEALKFYADVLNNIKFTEDGKIAYIVDDSLSEKNATTGEYFNESITLDREGLEEADAKSIFDKVLGEIMPNIEGVEIATKINAKENLTKGTIETGASLRGNGVPVDEFAKKHGGGGHEFAAAFIGSKAKAVDIVKNLSEYLKFKEQQSP